LSDWNNLDAEISDVVACVRAQKTPTAPFEFLAMSSSPEDQLICTKQCLADQPSPSALWRGEKYTHDRIHSANRQRLLLPSEFFQSGELGKL